MLFREYQHVVQEAVEAYMATVLPLATHGQYLAVLKQNTKRIQGSLVMFGYELEGGTNTPMITRAALAIELFHAYMQCLEQGIDIDQAVRTAHEAEIILANVEAPAENRLKAVSITNRTMMLATLARNSRTKNEDALHWRATEATLNPLHVGQVLAGAGCARTNAVTEPALIYGKQLVQGNAGSPEEFIATLHAPV